jgi:2-C-methyl-D-erythritol 4-phosphate cytidylyltransferase
LPSLSRANLQSLAAIIPAAGEGRRLGGSIPKAFRNIFGKPLLIHTLHNLLKAAQFKWVFVAVARDRVAFARKLLDRWGLRGVWVVVGGKTRAESVWNALEALPEDTGIVLVHDAARPMVSQEAVQSLIKEVKYRGAAILAGSVSSTVKIASPKTQVIEKTLDRSRVFLAQTPQGAQIDVLRKAYAKLGAKALEMTDEAAILEAAGVRVRIVDGGARNIKITVKEDLEIFKAYARWHRI